MTKRGIKALKKVVNEYQTIDGASRLGAFRDCVTDVLHVALRDKKLIKEQEKVFHADPTINFDDWTAHLSDAILSEGRNMFLSELEDAERFKIETMPRTELLCHDIREYNFEENRKYFEQRLKGERK